MSRLLGPTFMISSIYCYSSRTAPAAGMMPQHFAPQYFDCELSSYITQKNKFYINIFMMVCDYAKLTQIFY